MMNPPVSKPSGVDLPPLAGIFLPFIAFCVDWVVLSGPEQDKEQNICSNFDLLLLLCIVLEFVEYFCLGIGRISLAMIVEVAMRNVSVRADFFEDGTIVPLSVTDVSGKAVRIDRVISMSIKGDTVKACMLEFVCRIGENRRILLFHDNTWSVNE